MKRLIVLALAAVAAFGSSAQDLPPNETDLKASYCFGYLQTVSANLGKMSAEDLAKPDIAGTRQQFAQSERQVQGYLVGRAKLLDMTGMLIAKQQGVEDVGRYVNEFGSCISRCKDAACVTNCTTQNRYRTKFDACVSGAYLPY